MKKVITYGTFDLFHHGHLNLLKRAKELGVNCECDDGIKSITLFHFGEIFIFTQSLRGFVLFCIAVVLFFVRNCSEITCDKNAA